jgi:chloramphenicol-sensitive protein RarD
VSSGANSRPGSPAPAAGYAYATAAYLFWGVAPVYFVWVSFALPLEILAHRILWALPCLFLLVTAGRQWKVLRTLDFRSYALLACCSLLLSVNWLTFIYGVSQHRIAETSLGYFLNPLVTIGLGTFFLKERLRRVQMIAVALAASGIAYELYTQGSLPWIALSLATSFGLYGLLRKKIAVPAAIGLGIETAFVAPLSLAFLIFYSLPERDTEKLAMLALGGVVTVVPLVWFGAAAMRLPLTILGFFQFLAPSISLVIAIYFYGESVTPARWGSFAMVWFGLLVFSAEGVLRGRLAKSV